MQQMVRAVGRLVPHQRMHAIHRATLWNPLHDATVHAFGRSLSGTPPRRLIATSKLFGPSIVPATLLVYRLNKGNPVVTQKDGIGGAFVPNQGAQVCLFTLHLLNIDVFLGR